jgi:beta-glucosidase-like glycosyl hydrolase
MEIPRTPFGPSLTCCEMGKSQCHSPGLLGYCFPCATGTGASFDIALLRKIGESLGEECRARGVHCLLGPTTNIQRDPRGGTFTKALESSTSARVTLDIGGRTQKTMHRPPISNVTLAEVEDSRALVKVSSRLPSRLR